MQVVDKLISILTAELGYLEKKSNANLDDKTANAGSNNWNKYARDMAAIGAYQVQAQAWCDVFADWAMVQTVGAEKAKQLLGGWAAYTPTSANYYKKMNRWHTSNPQPGDQIFFKNSTRICHTGWVIEVKDGYVHTIEGNTSGASGVVANGGGVCKKKYTLNNSRIAGYGRPDWESVEIAEVKNPAAYRYKVGDIVRISTHYVGANDPVEKAVATDIEVQILDIVNGAKNPYHTNHNTYINDGDIRGYGQATLTAAASTTSTIGFDQNIKDLQIALNADGFTDAYGRKLKEDGIWGPNTAAAVAKVCLSTKTIQKYINVTAWVQCRVGTNPDGLFGNGTKEAVKVFQSNHRISADGIAGKDTILTIVRMYVPNAA